MTDESATAVLRATAARLWPPPSQVRISHSRRRTDRPAGHRILAEFALLPSADRPRLAVPLHAPRVAGRMLRRFSHDLSVPARTARAMAAGLLSVPGAANLLGAALRHRLIVSAAADATSGSLADRLAELLGVDTVVLGFGVGTPRANQKPVLPVCAADGTPLAFVKVGDTPIAADLVRAETSALRTFTASGMPDGIEVPEVMHHDRWHRLELLVLSPIVTSRRRWRRRDTIPSVAMREFAGHLGTARMPLAETPGWRALQASPTLHDDDRQAAVLRRAIAMVEVKHGDHEVEAGCWHGDWTAWNMSWRENRVQLWDFERFESGVPIGLDYAHYRVQSTLRAGGTDGAEQLLANGLPADPVAHGSNPVDLVEAAYLLQLADRYVQAARPAEGAPLRPRTRWLLDFITRRWL